MRKAAPDIMKESSSNTNRDLKLHTSNSYNWNSLVLANLLARRKTNRRREDICKLKTAGALLSLL
jgi:hypothetical protein